LFKNIHAAPKKLTAIDGCNLIYWLCLAAGENREGQLASYRNEKEMETEFSDLLARSVKRVERRGRIASDSGPLFSPSTRGQNGAGVLTHSHFEFLRNYNGKNKHI